MSARRQYRRRHRPRRRPRIAKDDIRHKRRHSRKRKWRKWGGGAGRGDEGKKKLEMAGILRFISPRAGSKISMIDGDLADYTVQQPSTHAPAGPAVAPESPPALLAHVIGCALLTSDRPLQTFARELSARLRTEEQNYISISIAQNAGQS